MSYEWEMAEITLLLRLKDQKNKVYCPGTLSEGCRQNGGCLAGVTIELLRGAH